MVQAFSPVKAQVEKVDWAESFVTVANAIQGVVRLAAEKISTPADLHALVKVSNAMRSVFKTALDESPDESCQQRLLTAYLKARQNLSQVYGTALKNVEKI